MQNENPLVTIITPCHNSSRFLSRYFESLLSQNFRDFEIVVINNGSTDDTNKVCERYSQKFNKLIYIERKESMMPEAARAIGFETANGKYVISIDSDDYCSNDFLSSLVNLAEGKNLDFAISSCQKVDEAENVLGKRESLVKQDTILESFKSRKLLFKGRYSGWLRLCKKCFLVAHGYDYSQAELPLFLISCYADARVGFARNGTYFYRINSTSISHKNVSSTVTKTPFMSYLDWYNRDKFPKEDLGILSTYFFRMILPFTIFCKSGDKTFDYKKSIRTIKKKIGYKFRFSCKYFWSMSKRDKPILFCFMFHLYWPAFFYVKHVR